MPTPEGRIKQKIKSVLDKFQGRIYVYMPVPGGYGAQSLDYLGWANGRGFAIEAKRPKGHTTLRQDGVIETMQAAGGVVFEIDGDAGCVLLEEWLILMCRRR